MNKISIKVTLDHLTAVLNLLSDFGHPYTIQQKVVYSIIDELGRKLQKKAIDKSNSKKPFQISLKYYEGYALYEVVKYGFSYLSSSSKPFEWNACHIIKNQIDKQL